MILSDKIKMFFATGAYLGRIPFASGTFGTLAGIPLALVFLVIPAEIHGFYITGLVLVAIYFADQAEKIEGKKDPGCIVIDEMAGYVVTMSLVPVQMGTLAAGFILFRIFDVLKPGPVRYFEENFSGGAGVVLDDIMAGIFSALTLKILYSLGIF